VRELLGDADLRFVWRHLPLSDVHPQAQVAAEAAEAAAAQGAFWQMHDLLLDHQDNCGSSTCCGTPEQLGLDRERFRDDLVQHYHEARVAQDVESADLSGVSGTPTFFINGRRHYGAYDIATLTTAIPDRPSPRRHRRLGVLLRPSSTTRPARLTTRRCGPGRRRGRGRPGPRCASGRPPRRRRS